MDVLFEDSSLLVLDKPAGLPVLPDGWERDAPYLLKAVEAEHGKVWVVHRLDKVTSGVLVLARTADAHRVLSMEFEKHTAEKTYHAIAMGKPHWLEKTANHPLRANVGHRHRAMVDRRTGKRSRTQFKVLEQYLAHALIEARPVTGRTHQVRVHAAALGHPLLGDELYGAPATDLIARPALHAFSLIVKHPESGEPLCFRAPYPPDFVQALNAVRSLVP
jgi:RluA family pseudouridine synthase